MIRHSDYPLFFSGLVKEFCSQPEAYRMAIANGMSPKFWPDCDAKTIALEFDHKAQSKSLEYAAMYTAKKADKLPEYRIPKSINELICIYNEFRDFGHGVKLGQAIQRDPLKANELVAAFKTNSDSQVKVHHVQAELHDYIANHAAEYKNEKEFVVKIPGWPLLSNGIDGFNPARVILIAAQTGVGKTNLSLNLALAASKKMPVLYFNMEMLKNDMYQRIVQMGAKVSKNEWRSNLSQAVSERAGKLLSDLYSHEGLYITDGRALAIEEICSTIYRRVDEDKIKFVIVDYDQKIRTKHRVDEWQALQRAIEELEEVAKVTETCIIVLCQADDNNLPKASKRMVQSASVLLSFFKEGESYFLETNKNRNNDKIKLKIKVDFTTLSFSEDSYVAHQKTQDDFRSLR